LLLSLQEALNLRDQRHQFLWVLFGDGLLAKRQPFFFFFLVAEHGILQLRRSPISHLLEQVC
jgi:hypothetical protein